MSKEPSVPEKRSEPSLAGLALPIFWRVALGFYGVPCRNHFHNQITSIIGYYSLAVAQANQILVARAYGAGRMELAKTQFMTSARVSLSGTVLLATAAFRLTHAIV